MKKCLLTFLLFALTPIMSFGVGPLTSVVKTAETEQTLDKLIDPQLINAMARRLAQSYPEHREELQKFIFDKEREFDLAGDSEYTNNIYSGFTKFFMLLSHKVFDEIKERELDRIQKYSQFTGREIKQDISAAANKYDVTLEWKWLDRGNLDSDACIPNSWDNCADKNKTFECYANEAQKWCDYPDGFEDYVVYIKEGSGLSTISSMWDDKSNNQSKTVIVKWWHDGDKYSQYTNFSYSELLYNYAEMAEWRNRNRKAMRDGIYLKSTYCGWADTKTDIKCRNIVNKELSDFYPNGNDVQPTAYVTSYKFSNQSSIDQPTDKEKFDLVTKYLLEKSKK